MTTTRRSTQRPTTTINAETAEIAGILASLQAFELKQRIGYVPEAAELYETLSAQESLELCGRLHEIEERLLLQYFVIFRHAPVTLLATVLFAMLAYATARVSLRAVQNAVIHNIEIIAAGPDRMFKGIGESRRPLGLDGL